ncbi:hypothetical protein [Paenibacillus cookii]|uniref:Lipoprotein n=1 Tax=Paenibacillus cookii TaxID=157839 RepID=A0ABQ4LU87_9BACL|nr:hypothetical protein [Paenibacillus cookii]GIO66683.1 hypothetical protein J21TS3_15040 [Paenibacillus cookii]
MSGITKAAVLTMLAAFLLGGCATKGAGTGTAPAAAAKPPAVQADSIQAPDAASNKDILPDSDAVPVTIDGKTYFFPNRDPNNKEFVHAAATSKGIVWTTAPEMKDSESELGKIPLEPFAIYLHASSETSVSFQNSKLAYKLPLQDDDANWYFPSGLYGNVKDHVIINAYRRKPGMAQPKYSELLDLDLATGKAKTIRIYHDAGGNLFEAGINDRTGDVVTVQAKPNDADYTYGAEVYHTATGKSEKVKKYTRGQGGITYWIGKTAYEAPFADLYR